jgi:DNA mismatch endonuclease Vsr
MMDKITTAERSALMARVRSRDTKPEMVIRRMVFRMGHRYRLHRRDLPGSPDLVFVAKRKIIFVHGCFWHQHSGCRCVRRPTSRTYDLYKTAKWMHVTGKWLYGFLRYEVMAPKQDRYGNSTGKGHVAH